MVSNLVPQNDSYFRKVFHITIGKKVKKKVFVMDQVFDVNDSSVYQHGIQEAPSMVVFNGMVVLTTNPIVNVSIQAKVEKEIV